MPTPAIWPVSAFTWKRRKAAKSLKRRFYNNIVTSLYKRELSSRTIARNLSALRNLFRFLLAESKIDTDPTEHLTAPRQWSTIPKFLNREQMEALIAAPDRTNPAGQRDRAMLEILYATGMRVSELISLRTSNLDGGLGIVRVTGKGNKQRHRAGPCRGACGRSGNIWKTGAPVLLKGQVRPDFLSLPEGARMTRQAFWTSH